MAESLGELIQRRMNEMGLKKAETARRLGISASYLGDLANNTGKANKKGRYNPSQELIEKLIQVLKIPRQDILTAMKYLPPSPTKLRNFDESPFAALYFKHTRISAKKKAEFQRILEMVDRELDRLEEE